MKRSVCSILKHVLFVFTIVTLTAACSRPLEKSSRVRLSFPTATGALESKVSGLVSSGSSSWGVSAPSSINQVLCYAVTVGSTDLNSKSCKNLAGTEVLSYGVSAGAFAADSGTIELIVPSGANRVISIIGFAATSTAACISADLAPYSARGSLSAPHILGSKKVDLAPGETTVNITASVTGSTVFENCTSPFFDTASSGTSPAPSVALLAFTAGTSAYNLNDVLAYGTSTARLTLVNNGAATATTISGGGLASPFQFKGGTYPGSTGNCGSSLASGASCNMDVTFSSNAVGAFSDQIEISYNDGAATQTAVLTLNAKAVDPGVLSFVDGASYDFGTVAVGGYTSYVFTVNNTGTGNASAMAMSVPSTPFYFVGGTYPGTGGTCGTTLASGQSCTVVMKYAPVATTPVSSSVTLSYNNGGTSSNASITLQGSGAAVALLAIDSGPTYDFQSYPQATTALGVVTVTNTGGVAATGIAEIGLAAPFGFRGGGAYPGDIGTCGTSLAAGASCTIAIRFSPTSLGTFNDTIELSYNNGAALTTATRPITGTGVTVAMITISDSSYNYGTQVIGVPANKTFTLTNVGGYAALSMNGSGLANPFLFVGGTYPGTGGTCTSFLAAGATCTIVVQFSPLVVGVVNDTIEINYNDGATNQTATNLIQGTGSI